MNSQRGNILVILLALVAIAGLSAAGYFYFQNQQLQQSQQQVVPQPTQAASPSPTAPTDETASWKTYQNQNYNFGLKYPPTLRTTEFENMPISIGQTAPIMSLHEKNSAVSPTGLSDAGSIYLNVYKASSSIKLPEWLKQASIDKSIPVEEYDFTESSGSEIASGIFIKPSLTGEKDSNFIARTVYIKKRGVILEFKTVKVTHSNEWRNVFDQILSTFRFD